MLVYGNTIMTSEVYRLPNGQDVIYNNSSVDVASLITLYGDKRFEELNRILDFYVPRGIIKTRIIFKLRSGKFPHKYISIAKLLKSNVSMSCPLSGSAIVKNLFQTAIKTKFARPEKEAIQELMLLKVTGKLETSTGGYVSREHLADYTSIYYYIKQHQ